MPQAIKPPNDRAPDADQDRRLFVRRCHRFLEKQRRDRLEPYIIFGLTSLGIGPLVSLILLLNREHALSPRRLVAAGLTCLVGAAAAAMIARRARVVERTHSGRRLGETWSSYQARQPVALAPVQEVDLPPPPSAPPEWARPRAAGVKPLVLKPDYLFPAPP